MGAALVQIASDAKRESHPEETLAVARGIYLRLPAGAPLWLAGPEFTPADPDRLHRTLA
jgi:hypothetical protein